MPFPQDVPALLEAIRESLVQLRRFMLWSHFDSTFDPEFQLARIQTAQEDYLSGKDYVFHLWQGERCVGGAGLHPRALNPRALEVGYWIRTSTSGRGLATAAVQALACFNFEFLKNERLQCFVNAANQGSLRVAEKCGFRREGEFKYWEARGNEQHREQGFQSAASGFMHSIVVDELDSLDWYPRAVAATQFLT